MRLPVTIPVSVRPQKACGYGRVFHSYVDKEFVEILCFFGDGFVLSEVLTENEWKQIRSGSRFS